MRTTLEQTTGEIVAANPAAARVFEQFGIDYCCGGKRMLTAACARADVSLSAVVESLNACAQPRESGMPNGAALSDLTHYIVERHHAFVRDESPRIHRLLDKVCGKHVEAHPELAEVKTLFTTLDERLAEHMLKEERILFPYIDALSASTEPPAGFGSVASPIATMIADHDEAGAKLSRIHFLTSGYKAPQDACPSLRALYGALAGFERDLHWHVHLENNVLFPRAISTECALRKAPPLAV